LGGVFQATGNASPLSVPAKGERPKAKGQIHAPENFQRYMDAVYRAIWVDGLSLNDPVTKDPLKAATMKSVERGVFGAPTFFVDHQVFCRQDRIDQVNKALMH